MSRVREGTMTKMNKTMKIAWLVAGLWCASAQAASAQVNQLTSLVIGPRSGGVEARIECSQPPVFNVFRLNDPDRLIVDVTQAKVASIAGHHEGLGPVTGMVVTQFSDSKTEVGRVLFGLDNARKYDVRVVDKVLVVSIEALAVSAPVSQAAPPPKPTQTAIEAAGDQAESVMPRAAEGAQAAGGEATSSETIVASRVDERRVRRPATRLKRVAVENGRLRLVTDGEVARFEVIELAQPARLALDLFGVRGTPKVSRASMANVKDIRLGSHEEKVRVVMEFEERRPFDVRRRPDGLEVTLQAGAQPQISAAVGAEEPIIEIDGKQIRTDSEPAEPAVAQINDVAFHETSSGGTLELKIHGNAQPVIERPNGQSAVMNLDGIRMAHDLERSFDTSALATPVKMVSVFSVPGASARVRVVAAAGQDVDQWVTKEPGKLLWHFAAKGATQQLIATNRSAGFATEATQVAQEGAPQQRTQYVGKRQTFEFKDIDLHNFLRIIADISKKNIIVGDDVSGRITIRLRNVPWDQALDIVLRSKSLGMEQFGNIVRIAPLGALESEAKARAERKRSERLMRDLSVVLISVNYATAGEMSARVKEVLSERGNVTVDARTNTLIVRDLPENMGKIRSLVASLDLQTPQVLIEGRIVEASTRFAREIGVQWGGQGLMTAANGNPTGLVFPNSVALTGGIAGGGNAGTGTPANYAVSLPVGAGEGSGGIVGLAFGSAGGAAQLNLRLSALESQGSIKTISAPRISTLDNATAKISQGVSIPFSQVSAAGANTSFVEARLSLEVTPHVTQDGSVVMQISAQNNQPDPSNAGAFGQPGISKKEANTNVLVKDGETTVIGGIYVRTGSSNQAGLPILSKIPVIGFFFRNYRELETKNELLVFITPRILNRAAVAQNP